jgi:hypothetical protein
MAAGWPGNFLVRCIRELGVSLGQARSKALFRLAAGLPAAVLARILAPPGAASSAHCAGRPPSRWLARGWPYPGKGGRCGKLGGER